MFSDVVDLHEFYQSHLGQAAQHILRRKLREIWPDVTGLSVLGVGYASPFLRPFMQQADRVAAVMPAGQGVIHWPREEPGLTVLVDEAELPFADLSVDRLLLVHSLECTEQLRRMLRECWRVLTGNGRLLVVAPNRRGLWARFERTPFGQGTPYSRTQLSRLLRDMTFTPMQSRTALFVPPGRWRLLLRSAPLWERIGSQVMPSFAGVIMVEATKQVYAGNAEPASLRRRLLPMRQPSTAKQRRDNHARDPAPE
ncbi:MAG: methyltransferase domain-containing protein [Rhodospirillales bacterium]